MCFHIKKKKSQQKTGPSSGHHPCAAVKQFPDMNAILGAASDGKCDDTHFVDGEAEV